MSVLLEKHPICLENRQGKSIKQKLTRLAHNEHGRPSLHVSGSGSKAWKYPRPRTYPPVNIMSLLTKCNQEGHLRDQRRQISKYKHNEG